MENIEDMNRREERYFELLREWKGFIMICVDITVEFDEFQERIKHEYIKFHLDEQMRKHELQSMNDDAKKKDMNKIEWDNRKYFLNNDEMPYLKHNIKEDKITRNVYVSLNSDKVHSLDADFNFFDILAETNRTRVLENILAFVCVPGSFDNPLSLVCKDWQRFEQDHAENDFPRSRGY